MAWRDELAPIIARVIDHVGTDDMAELRKALREARPYQVCTTSWGKKVWYSEIKRQLRLKHAAGIELPKPIKPMPNQMELFEG